MIEAKRMARGKPIYPYISPHYAPSGDHKGQLVGREYFAKC